MVSALVSVFLLEVGDPILASLIVGIMTAGALIGTKKLAVSVKKKAFVIMLFWIILLGLLYGPGFLQSHDVITSDFASNIEWARSLAADRFGRTILAIAAACFGTCAFTIFASSTKKTKLRTAAKILLALAPILFIIEIVLPFLAPILP